MLKPHNLRYLLWLLYHCKDQSNRMIALAANCSHPTVAKLRQILRRVNLSWDEVTEKKDSELKALLYHKGKSHHNDKVDPDYQAISQQFNLPKKHRKTLAMLFKEYQLRFGSHAYGKTIFYEKVRTYLKSQHVVMKQHYLPAEIMCIDYAGTKLKYNENGQTRNLNVFVACLGYSKKIFAFATPNMKSESWVHALVKAFDYFGGVPDTIQFDNAKAMVKQSGRLALFHQNVQLLSLYYHFFCDTSRVGTPTDNAVAENAVKIVNAILVQMRADLIFFSISEVNDYLRKAVEDTINTRPFQKLHTTRNELFIIEQPKLKPLPSVPYEPVMAHKELKVPSTYLIPYKGHEYSVPHAFAHKQVTLRVTIDELIVFHDGKEIARHTLNEQQGSFTRLPEHMKPEHLAEQRKSLPSFLAWAKGVGEDAEKIVRKQYAPFQSEHARRAGKQCLVLQALCKNVGHDSFNKACHFGLSRKLYSPDSIEEIINTKAYEQEFDISHANHFHIRNPHNNEVHRYDH